MTEDHARARADLGRHRFDSHGAKEAANVVTEGTLKGAHEICPRAAISIISMVPFDSDEDLGFHSSIRMVSSSPSEQLRLVALHTIPLMNLPFHRRIVAALSIIFRSMLPGLVPDPRSASERPGTALLFLGIGMVLSAVFLLLAVGPSSVFGRAELMIGVGLITIHFLRIINR